MPAAASPGVERVEHDAGGAPLGEGSCSSLMKRRFIGNATSTPMLEMTTLKIIMCHHGHDGPGDHHVGGEARDGGTM